MSALRRYRAFRRFLTGLIAGLIITAPVFAAHKYPAPPPEFFKTNQLSRVPVIAPGDVLSIGSYYSPELNRVVHVRQDGKISLVMFQGIDAAGMTPEQLQSKLTQLFSKEFKDPVITVDLDSSVNSSIYVTGEVGQPGAVEWHGNMTVAMALAVSQAKQRTAGLHSVFLIRRSDTNRYRVYKLDASLPGGKSRDVQMQPGDLLFVPRKFIVKADDFMEQYVRDLLPGTPTLGTDVIFTPGNAIPSVATTSATTTVK